MGKVAAPVTSQLYLATLTEREFSLWLRRALNGHPEPLPPFAPSEPLAAALAILPRDLTGETLSRFRAALSRQLADFGRQPDLWAENEAEELIALADLLGTKALPGRTPLDLGVELSLKPLVEIRSEAFERLPSPLRFNVLGLLSANPRPMPARFWLKVADRRPEYQAIAWSGLLRADWLKACGQLRKLPTDEESLVVLRYYVRDALRRMQQDETGMLRTQMAAALPRAAQEVRALFEEEGAKMGVHFSGTPLAEPFFLLSLVGLWLGLGLPGEGSSQLLDNDGKPLSPHCLAAFSKALNYGLRQDDVLTADDAFANAENYLRTQCPADSEEIEILNSSKSKSPVIPTPDVYITAKRVMMEC